ncbi:MAG: cation:proton antiporter [Desulfamplus sp.]|nr:cation:proton antiporter [Desulfamplus sp.]
MTSYNIIVLLMSLGVLLTTALALGELAQRFHQPAVLGELLAGVLLGPTVLGALAPEIGTFLFPLQGPNAIAMDALSTLAIVLFLLVAGMEIDLSTVWKQGRVGCKLGIASIAVPFSMALGAAFVMPGAFGRHVGADPVIFALFLSIAISISALPIIAKTLMDMGLYRTDLGMVVVSAAIFNDIVGWIIFALLLGLINMGSGHGGSVVMAIPLTLIFTGAVLTLGRRLIHRAIPFVQAYTRWPGGELSFALILGLFGAAFTEWIGIHAIFGAFIVGAAVGDSFHLRERTRAIIDNFISFIFAPIFFAGIGLKVNFFAHFDLSLVIMVTLTALICKLAGGILGARWGGMQGREALAAGFAMVSVGAMGIIVGMIALEAGIISRRLFVALIVMAIVTSMISGPSIRLILRPEKRRKLYNMLSSKLFIREFKARSRPGVIQEMVYLSCTGNGQGLDAPAVNGAVWSREEAMSTGIGSGVAIPHARIKGLKEPLVAVGISSRGIDFDAPDGRAAHLIFLVLTPAEDPMAQLEIASEIARLARDMDIADHALCSSGFTDFLALLKAPGAIKK